MIFADLELQPSDDLNSLRPYLKFLPRRGNGPQRAAQPCKAHDGCRCAAYEVRPSYCRQFDCKLLKRLQKRSVTDSGAMRIVRKTRAKVQRVEELLEALGDSDKSRPLLARVKRANRQLPKADLAALHSELSLAWHELTCLLGAHFYSPP